MYRESKNTPAAGRAASIAVPGIGEPVLLRISDRAKRLSITVRNDGSVRVTIPRGVSAERATELVESKRDWIKRSLEKLREPDVARRETKLPALDRVRARAMLIGRLERLARIHGFEYNKASVRNQRTRWGSCSSRNNISLNARLAGLPDELRDYVIMHELVHTKFKNHGKRFWRELDRRVGDAKAMQKRLRGYRMC